MVSNGTDLYDSMSHDHRLRFGWPPGGQGQYYRVEKGVVLVRVL